MPSSSNSLTALIKTLISKMKEFRFKFTQHGYSQSEFQQYFLAHVFDQKPENCEKVSQILTQKLSQIKNRDQVEKILGVIDQELQSLSLTAIAYEKQGEAVDLKQNSSHINKQQIRKRKGSREVKQTKIQKKSNAERRKKSKQLQTKNQYLKADSQLPSLLLKQGSSNAFLKYLQMKQAKDTNDLIEKESIFQKILKIKMLTKLMCGQSQQLTQQIRNPFSMRC